MERYTDWAPVHLKTGRWGGKKIQQTKENNYILFLLLWEMMLQAKHYYTDWAQEPSKKKKKKKLRVLELRTPTFVMGPGIGTANRTRFLSVLVSRWLATLPKGSLNLTLIFCFNNVSLFLVFFFVWIRKAYRIFCTLLDTPEFCQFE